MIRPCSCLLHITHRIVYKVEYDILYNTTNLVLGLLSLANSWCRRELLVYDEAPPPLATRGM